MTSAFVPFHSESLPSPPLTTYIHPISTKLPSLFDHRTRTNNNNSSSSFISTSKDDLLKSALPSYGYSLPPLQDIMSVSSPSLPPQLSPPSEDEDFPSRKGSIASILNSAPELRQLDEEEFRSGYQSHFNDTSLKRGRPRVVDQQQQPLQTAAKRRRCHDHPQQQPSPPSEPVPRANKGLRHFSKQVCDKVAEKGVTTYNEVADELALDIRATMEAEGNDKRSFDQKNIRRRVYDALNVLMAMDIIAKDKKQIKWLGIPTCFQEEKEDRNLELQKQVDQEERRQAELMSSINRTRGLIRDKLAQHLQLCNLVWRNYHNNKESEQQQQQQAVVVNDDHLDNDSSKVSLPFFIVACPTQQDLTVNVASDRRSAEISHASMDSDDDSKNNNNNNNRRVVYEDADVLRHLHLNRISSDQLAAWLPDPALQSFLSVRHTTDSSTSSIYIQSSADLCTTSAS